MRYNPLTVVLTGKGLISPAMFWFLKEVRYKSIHTSLCNYNYRTQLKSNFRCKVDKLHSNIWIKLRTFFGSTKLPNYNVMKIGRVGLRKYDPKNWGQKPVVHLNLRAANIQPSFKKSHPFLRQGRLGSVATPWALFLPRSNSVMLFWSPLHFSIIKHLLIASGLKK